MTGKLGKAVIFEALWVISYLTVRSLQHHLSLAPDGIYELAADPIEMPTTSHQNIYSAVFFSGGNTIGGTREDDGSYYRLDIQEAGGLTSLNLGAEADLCLGTTLCVGYVSLAIAGTSQILIGVTNSMNSPSISSTVFFLDEATGISRNWGFRSDSQIRTLIFIPSQNRVISGPYFRSRSYVDGSGDIVSSYSHKEYLEILDYDSSLGLVGFVANIKKTFLFNETNLSTSGLLTCLNNYDLVAMKILKNTNYMIACMSSNCQIVNVAHDTLFADMVSGLNLVSYSLVVDPAASRFGYLDESKGGLVKMHFIDFNNSVIKTVFSAEGLQDTYLPYSNSQGGALDLCLETGMMVTGLANYASLFKVAACLQPCQTCDPNDPAQCLECPSDAYSLVNGTCVIPQLNCDSMCETCFDTNTSKCLTCASPLVWNSTTYTCTYPCPENCLSCEGKTKSDCTVCQLGFSAFQGLCQPCEINCLQCSIASGKICTLCQSETSVLSRGSCLVCNSEAEYLRQPYTCTEGDEETVFLDWDFKVKPQSNITSVDVPAVQISVILFNSTLELSADDIFRLFSTKLERKDIIKTTYTNIIIVQFKNSLKGQDLVEIEMSIAEKGNLITEREGIAYRLVNRTRKVLYGAANSTILGNLDIPGTAKPIAAIIQTASLLSLSSSCCSANVGGSLINFIQIIEIYGKLYYSPSYFSPLMNLSLYLVEKIGNGLKVSDSWVEDPIESKRSRYFFKLSDYSVNHHILGTIPIQVISYLVTFYDSVFQSLRGCGPCFGQAIFPQEIKDLCKIISYLRQSSSAAESCRLHLLRELWADQ